MEAVSGVYAGDAGADDDDVENVAVGGHNGEGGEYERRMGGLLPVTVARDEIWRDVCGRMWL